MEILSPSVQIFELEYRDLNATSDLATVFGGIPSAPYVHVGPVYKNTNISKEVNVPVEYNCNNVHYEICKENGLNVGLLFEYDNTKKKIIPFTNFRNMLYFASFDSTIDVCFIKTIKKFYNGIVIGDYSITYEELEKKFRVQELTYRDISLNVVTKKWTFEYNDGDILVKEYSSTNGVSFGLVREVHSTNKDENNKEYDVQFSQTYIESGKVIDYQKCVYAYTNTTRSLVGFDRENYSYMRFSTDVDGRAKVISYQKEWNTVIACNIFYYAEKPFVLSPANLNVGIICEQYFGVKKEGSRRIEIVLDERKPPINAFSDMSDYGLAFLSFDKKHKHVEEIKYYNEIDVLYQKATPKYRPDNLIDSLIFERIESDGVAYSYHGIMNYYYDLEGKLYKVMFFDSDEVLVKHYTVSRDNKGRIETFINRININFDIHLEYKKTNGYFHKAYKVVNVNEPNVLWYKICYSGSNINGIYFENTLTIELKFLSSGACVIGEITGATDLDDPVATESVYIDSNNSLDYVYDYNRPKVHRFFMNENDWNFADGTGCQPYLKYIEVRKEGLEYFMIPFYNDKGLCSYVDVYEKINRVYTGNFIRRIEFLDTLGRESSTFELPNVTYDLMVAKPYMTKTGYFHTENSHAIKYVDSVSSYHILGYFDTDEYIIPSDGYSSTYPIYEPCPDDECDSQYWEDDFSSDYEYVVMCWNNDGLCTELYVEGYFLEYVDMCLSVACDEQYFLDEVIAANLRYVNACAMDFGCTDLYVDVDYSLDQDAYIQCPGG